MKNGRQLQVDMPFDCEVAFDTAVCYQAGSNGLQMGYSGHTTYPVPLLQCWGSDLGVQQSLLCINRSYNQSFTYPVQFAGSPAATAQMTLLAGQPGGHNEDDQPMVEPQFQTVPLANVTFPPRSLVRLEISASAFDLYLPLILQAGMTADGDEHDVNTIYLDDVTVWDSNLNRG